MKIQEVYLVSQFSMHGERNYLHAVFKSRNLAEAYCRKKRLPIDYSIEAVDYIPTENAYNFLFGEEL